ncbi:hypothetical protein KUTeg_006544 [Tegillarca granosa]|uniref:Uncharacterized protein n=1 Tax=Tegillarca granosa TaxID=220873 RepID=A0ABQ9FHZ4_TEGGR|nr:hypothetical protein KUTeg_006544 [Tegillarca granosa]
MSFNENTDLCSIQNDNIINKTVMRNNVFLFKYLLSVKAVLYIRLLNIVMNQMYRFPICDARDYSRTCERVEWSRPRKNAKQIAINVVKHCFDEAKQKCLINPISCPLERASAMTGVPRRTLSRLKSFGIETKQADRKRRSDKFFIDDFDICSQNSTRQYIEDIIINDIIQDRTLNTCPRYTLWAKT